MQIFAFAGKKFFHQRHAQALRNAAFDLSFNQRGIDCAAHIVRRGDLQHAHRSQFDVDFDLRHVSAEAEDRVRTSLPIFVERTGRRIECRLAGDDVSV